LLETAGRFVVVSEEGAMSDLLFGTGDGPLLRLVQAYPFLAFGVVLCTGLLIYSLLYPERVADGGDFPCIGDHDGGGDSGSD
jgi:hypothetical protein